jgi:uncharacterized membrane protein
MNTLKKQLVWITLFSIAMGFMETAVVVYLREIYYPNGFCFPLIPIDASIAQTEFYRELATIIMLLGIGILTGKTPSQKFSFFIYSFAIWDLFYYVFLKLLLDWPASLFTWDILFLIPVPWVGPVITPCIVSLTMIALTLIILYFHEKGISTKIHPKEWILLTLGSLTVILSFVWDYIKYINQGGETANIWTLSSHDAMFQDVSNYIPTSFNWWLFATGEGILIFTLLIYTRRIKNER